MSHFYPQAAMKLRVLFEDFGTKDSKLVKEHIITVLPKRVTVNINDYRQADTFNATIEYKNFPFDPRSIKALGVSIYIKDMKHLYGNDGRFNKIVPSESNVVFQGFADEENVDFDDKNRTVTFEGRDFTALLLDTPIARGTISLNKPVDIVLQDLIQELPATSKIVVENRTKEVLPILGKFFPDFGGMSGHKNVKRGETYWDVIQDIVSRAGLIGFIELDKFVIARPRNIYTSGKPYQFVYGRNLKSLKFSRKLSKQKGFNVRVRSLADKEVISADIPKDGTTEWGSLLGIPVGKDAVIKKPNADGSFKEDPAPVISFNVPNIKDKKQLIEVGQGIFEELGRQQIEGSLETKEMCILQPKQANSSRENSVEFDVTKIRNGTAIKIMIGEDDQNQLLALKSQAKMRKWLIDHCYPAAVADALVKSQIELREKFGKSFDTFYTKDVSYTVDAESGFDMKLNFINYIDISSKGLI